MGIKTRLLLLAMCLTASLGYAADTYIAPKYDLGEKRTFEAQVKQSDWKEHHNYKYQEDEPTRFTASEEGEESRSPGSEEKREPGLKYWKYEHGVPY